MPTSERTEGHAPGSAETAPAPGIGKAAEQRASAPSTGSSQPKQQTPTTRTYMRGHFADTVRMREAIVSGDLAKFEAAAASVANDPWSPNLRKGYEPYVDAVRAAARSAQSAESLTIGAPSLGELGDACASCHLKFGGPGSPIAPIPLATAADVSMAAHAAAAERLWEGLMLPSDASWIAGATALIEAPHLDRDTTEVAAAARHSSELARTAKDAAPPQRGRIFGDILLTCSACHEHLGVAAGRAR